MLHNTIGRERRREIISQWFSSFAVTQEADGTADISISINQDLPIDLLIDVPTR